MWVGLKCRLLLLWFKTKGNKLGSDSSFVLALRGCWRIVLIAFYILSFCHTFYVKWNYIIHITNSLWQQFSNSNSEIPLHGFFRAGPATCIRLPKNTCQIRENDKSDISNKKISQYNKKATSKNIRLKKILNYIYTILIIFKLKLATSN